MKKKVTAIIAAGGFGKRMGLRTLKPFIEIAGKPILSYSLDLFEKSNSIDSIVLVVAKGCLKKAKSLLKNKRYKKLKKIVSGGSTRARSVYNGLSAVGNNSDIVLIHDAARPFLTQALLKKCINAARRGVDCLAAVPVTSTIKTIRNRSVISTPQRKTLWEAQTPQVFNKDTLIKAYGKLGKKAWNFSDDASLAEACGVKVKVVKGDYSNIKITTNEDLKIAQVLLMATRKAKVNSCSRMRP